MAWRASSPIAPIEDSKDFPALISMGIDEKIAAWHRLVRSGLLVIE
jgi:hypothetical protein